MPYAIKPLSCDPARIKGMSERLIISHYENNYSGAVKRLNAIDEQLAQLEFDKAAGFLINRPNVGAPSLSPWERRSAAARDGCCCRGRHVIASSSTSGRPIIAIRWLAARQFWRSICTNTPIKWTLAPKQAATSTVSWR